jgi:DNA mismatch repair protein MutS2
MAKVGLYVPAREPVELPWFDQVLADIGDEQSLEQSLSTFSGHIRRISRILAALGERDEEAEGRRQEAEGRRQEAGGEIQTSNPKPFLAANTQHSDSKLPYLSPLTPHPYSLVLLDEVGAGTIPLKVVRWRSRF